MEVSAKTILSLVTVACCTVFMRRDAPHFRELVATREVYQWPKTERSVLLTRPDGEPVGNGQLHRDSERRLDGRTRPRRAHYISRGERIMTPCVKNGVTNATR